MDRRRLLGGMGAATATLLAGCSAVLDDGPEGVVLGEQSDQVAESEALAYPAYGQSLPSIELEDPLNGETIDVESIDRTMILTAIFTYCPAECGILLNQLAGVQGMIDEAGLTDDVAFLPITFDPERDDAEALADNAETIGADLSRSATGTTSGRRRPRRPNRSSPRRWGSASSGRPRATDSKITTSHTPS